MRSNNKTTRCVKRPAAPGTGRTLMRNGAAALSVAIASLLLTGTLQAEERGSKAAMIADALRAAPPNISKTATISDLNGNILRSGSGDYTCYPAPAGLAGPMCMDAEWRRWMAAWMNSKPFTAKRIGVSYMMAGDSPDGGASNIDPAASAPTADNEWVVEGPHLMIIVPNASAFDGLPTTVETDGPYVMWPGTPYVHLMVPVATRPKQRVVSSK